MTFKQLCDWAPLSSFFTNDTLSGQQYYYYYYYYYYKHFSATHVEAISASVSE